MPFPHAPDAVPPLNSPPDAPASASAAKGLAEPAGLRALVARLVDAREEERLRVARRLHDDVGQMLTALRLELGALTLSAGSPAQSERIAAVTELVGASMASLRQISEDLRPLMLDDLGLDDDTDWLGDKSSRGLGMEVRVGGGGEERVVERGGGEGV